MFVFGGSALSLSLAAWIEFQCKALTIASFTVRMIVLTVHLCPTLKKTKSSILLSIHSTILDHLRTSALKHLETGPTTPYGVRMKGHVRRLVGKKVKSIPDLCNKVCAYVHDGFIPYMKVQIECLYHKGVKRSPDAYLRIPMEIIPK